MEIRVDVNTGKSETPVDGKILCQLQQPTNTPGPGGRLEDLEFLVSF